MNPPDNNLNPQQEEQLLEIYNDPNIVNALEGGNYLFLEGAIKKALDILCSQLPEDIAINVLDLGCGGGKGGEIIIDELKKRKRTGGWVGVDISEAMIAQADQILSNKENIALIKGNFRKPNRELESILGSFNLITAFGTGDGIKDFFVHVNDILKYAEDGAVVLLTEYPEQTANTKNLDGVVPPTELGINAMTMAKNAIRHPVAFARFVMLGIGSKQFKEYTGKMNILTLDSILEFVRILNAKLAVVSNSSDYSPVIIRFQVTPELREKVTEHFIEQ